MNQTDIKKLFDLSLKAGQAIMEVYAQDFEVETKSDDSPLTLADRRSHQVITEGLTHHFPHIPIISEEGSHISYAERKDWKSLWLVDPLDGTKEFVKKNGEFTVNIARIEESYPTLGVIYVPAQDIFYFGQKGVGAYKLENASHYLSVEADVLIKQSISLPEKAPSEAIRVVASRSHMSSETQAFIDRLEGSVEVVSSGSSLKFCLVAEGKADYYPRYAPTMEWDTAAGQAIVEAAGGSVTRYEDQERFDYNRENQLNGWFLAANAQKR